MKRSQSAKKPLWKLLTTVRRAPPDKLAELQRLREIAFWRCYGFYSERQDGCSAALFSQVLAEDIDKLAKSHAATGDFGDVDDMKARTRLVAQWRAHTAELHKLADRAVAAHASYQDGETERFEAARRESWFLFTDADRAVVKAGGASAFGREYFPGVPDALNVRLSELGDCSGRE